MAVPRRLGEIVVQMSLPIVGLLALGLTSCGVLGSEEQPNTNGLETQTAEQVFEDARQAFLDVQSVHVKGRFVGPAQTVSFEARLLPRGGDLTETSEAGVARFLTKDSVFYLKVPSGNYETGGLQLTSEYQDRWLERSANSHEARISLADFFRDLEFDETKLRPEVTPEPGERPAVTIATTDGYRLRVSGVGPPLPLEYSSKSGDRIVFDQYDAPVTIEVPTETKKLSCGASYCDY